MKRAPAGRAPPAAHRATTTLAKALAHASNLRAVVGRRKVRPDNAGAVFRKILSARTIPRPGCVFLFRIFRCDAPSEGRWRARLNAGTNRLPESRSQSGAAMH